MSDTVEIIGIQDGLDISGNEVEASPEMVAYYDNAIRTGDLEYVIWMVSTYRHYDVPILHVDPYTMLDSANHETLLWLDEQEYIVLPDIVRAIIYDDPLLLYTRSMNVDMVRQILLRGAWEIFIQYRKEIVDIIRTNSKYFLPILLAIDPNDDVLQELLQYPDINRMYNIYSGVSK